MKHYTVVGYYPDNDQPYVSWFTAKNPAQAVKMAKATADDSLVVVEVLVGHNRAVLENESTIPSR